MYTEEELQAFISFYQTPTGKQIIKLHPKLVKANLLFADEVDTQIGPLLSAEDELLGESTLSPSENMELEVEIVGDGEGMSVRISMHPNESFNGEYKVQEGLINGRPWYQNDNNRYLFFHAEVDIETLPIDIYESLDMHVRWHMRLNMRWYGDEERIQNWNLDHRKPDGVWNWFSGGWTDPTESLPHPEPGHTYWYTHFR